MKIHFFKRERECRLKSKRRFKTSLVTILNSNLIDLNHLLFFFFVVLPIYICILINVFTVQLKCVVEVMYYKCMDLIDNVD